MKASQSIVFHCVKQRMFLRQQLVTELPVALIEIKSPRQISQHAFSPSKKPPSALIRKRLLSQQAHFAVAPSGLETQIE